MSRKNQKRDQLVESADKLFHQKGVSDTTLANIAERSQVPLGNVYYYFKSKEMIILAVIEARKALLAELFALWEQAPTIKARLAAFIRHTINLAQESAKFGDALGSLCQELAKQEGILGEAASVLMASVLTWCEAQFVELGHSSDTAKTLALNLVASLQGVNLITLTFNDPFYLEHHGVFLNEWLDKL